MQDVAQRDTLISRQESEMILTNPGTWIWSRTTNTATAERVSKIFGEMDREYWLTSVGISKRY